MTTLCTVLLCINCAKIMELRHSVHVTTWFDWVVFLTWMFKYTVEYNPYWTLTKQYLVFQCLSVKVFFKFKHKNLLITQLYKQWFKLFIFLRQRQTNKQTKTNLQNISTPPILKTTTWFCPSKSYYLRPGGSWGWVPLAPWGNA